MAMEQDGRCGRIVFRGSRGSKGEMGEWSRSKTCVFFSLFFFLEKATFENSTPNERILTAALPEDFFLLVLVFQGL